MEIVLDTLDIWVEIYKNLFIIPDEYEEDIELHCETVSIPNKISHKAFKIVLLLREQNNVCMNCGLSDFFDHVCKLCDCEECVQNRICEYCGMPNIKNKCDFCRLSACKDLMCIEKCDSIVLEQNNLCISKEGYLNNTVWKMCNQCDFYHNICNCGKYRKLVLLDNIIIPKNCGYLPRYSLNFKYYTNFNHHWICHNKECIEHGVIVKYYNEGQPRLKNDKYNNISY